jgi:membrane protein DedA with SNARE-associated domain
MLFAAEMFDGLQAYGYVGIIVYMILTGCGLPTPEEVAIIGAGVASAAGQLDWRLSLGSLLVGALAGDCVMYAIGYHFGTRLLQKNRLWNRLITPERERRVEGLLEQHGVKVLLGARFLPGIRGPMYITAGILKVPFKRFVVADLFCASLVVSLFFGISYLYGGQVVRAIREGEGWLTTIVLTVAVIAGGVGFLVYLRKNKRLKEEVAANPQGVTPVEPQPTVTEVLAVSPPSSSTPQGNGQRINSPPEMAKTEKPVSTASSTENAEH